LSSAEKQRKYVSSKISPYSIIIAIVFTAINITVQICECTFLYYLLLNRFPENKSGYFTFTGKRLGLLCLQMRTLALNVLPLTNDRILNLPAISKQFYLHICFMFLFHGWKIVLLVTISILMVL